MKFDSLAAFIEMGGHGPYVWAAYAIALLVILANFVWPLVIYRRNLAQLRQEFVEDGSRSQGQADKEQTA
ncbi:MAG: heme exporter protein CcmD [Pseudomonadota bacterium]